MIKSILGFINQKVYKTNQTNKKVYLSDGTSWNNSLFHQNVNIVREMLNYSISTDEEMKELRDLIFLKKKDLSMKLNLLKNKLSEIENDPFHLLAEVDLKLLWGKYKGLRFKDVYHQDERYLREWYFKKSRVSLENVISSVY